MQIEENETVADVDAVVTAVEALVEATTLLTRAIFDPKRRPYVDLAFDPMNTAMTMLQMVLTSTHHRRNKPGLRVVK